MCVCLTSLCCVAQVSLFLKPDAKEFLEVTKIEELLKKYSEFIQCKCCPKLFSPQVFSRSISLRL